MRITHWINAFAVLAMLGSGLKIYNASPLYDFHFPPDLTLGGWLAGALAWHFAVMWLLLFNGLAYLLYGVFSGHFMRKIFRFAPMAAYRSVRLEARRLLFHGSGEYNVVQRILYVVVVFDVVLLAFSGLALWKPVQFQGLGAFFGGYDQARYVHFYGMLLLAFFVFVHVIMALVIEGTIASMITGTLKASERRSRR